MNAQGIEELQAKLATALGLVTEVQSEVYKHMGYRWSRSAAHGAVNAISGLSRALDSDWKEDERELDEDLGQSAP